MQDINFRHIATQIGDSLKYSTSVNEIDRFGQAILRINKEDFPNTAITSIRAYTLYCWVLSLAKAQLEPSERIKRLISFCLEITPEEHKQKTIQFLENQNCPYNLLHKDGFDEFLKRNFHAEVIRHSQKLFINQHYFHAVFESVKSYNKDVKGKSKSEQDGQKLMLSVWGCENGVLKVTQCQSQTDKDFQDGIKFISGGLMSAIRNPTAHEPAINWPINKQDCLDIIKHNFISIPAT
jgi:uncharacterized protein (TIGR02391 family)